MYSVCACMCNYLDIYRRSVDIHERQFLQDSKVVTEMQCDLGM